MDNKIGTVRAKSSTFVWEINNFSNISKKIGEYIESPFFTIGEITSNTMKWQLVLYPFGKNDSSKDFLSLYLVCYFCGDIDQCDVSFKFFLWGSEREINLYTNFKLTTSNTIVACPSFRQREGQEIQKNLSLGNDTLKIACCINHITGYHANKIHQQAELIESFDSLFLCDMFSDVTIEVDDNKKLKAHKNILAARSEVFLAMFKHDTVENNENIIRITDFSYDVMKEVLRFIYCGKIEDLETHKEDLLVAADKYNLKFLKQICEQSIYLNMSANNIWEILNMSDFNNCNELKTKAANYLLEHLVEAIEQPGFKQVLESNPNLIGELLCIAAKSYIIEKR